MEATKVISIHALLAESDTALKTIKALFDTISIHALLAESDYRLPLLHTSYSNFYPRSPCGERPVPQQENGQAATISIHALLAESDKSAV